MRKIVAIVEDDPASLAALSSLVASFGYETLGFLHPHALLEGGAARRADVLLADIRLPELNGIALHRRLMASGIFLPTILVTAFPDEASRRMALEAGLFGYFAKPVVPEALQHGLALATGGGGTSA